MFSTSSMSYEPKKTIHIFLWASETLPWANFEPETWPKMNSIIALAIHNLKRFIIWLWTTHCFYHEQIILIYSNQLDFNNTLVQYCLLTSWTKPKLTHIFKTISHTWPWAKAEPKTWPKLCSISFLLKLIIWHGKIYLWMVK